MTTSSVRIGEYKHRIAIQRDTPIVDEQGGRIPNWSTIGRRWAKITPVRGDEVEVADKTQGFQIWRIKIRHFKGLTVRDQVLYRGREYTIQVIEEDFTRWERTQTLVVRELTT